MFQKDNGLIEIHWGEPLSFIMSPKGDVQTFSTIEQARYWLRKRWPVSDDARQRALVHVEAAMDCLTPIATARRAFIAAAQSAGFVAQPQLRAA
ncbi:DUF982 domain-containing protein [Paenirhodobacter sp.]|uniref:DUF982 domain-containing protein n=1 Tax=Paenirhodobacter sp. TaxID=1965326 RepID=UPI003B40BB5A